MNTLNEMTNSNEMPKPTLEKKNWVSPEIMTWEYTNIEFKSGGLVDGGAKSYGPG